MTSAASGDVPRASIEQLLAEYEDLQARLNDPGVHADQAVARRLGRRYAELTPIVTTSTALDEARGDLQAARELTAEDASFARRGAGRRRAGRRVENPAGGAHPRVPDDRGRPVE